MLAKAVANATAALVLKAKGVIVVDHCWLCVSGRVVDVGEGGGQCHGGAGAEGEGCDCC